MSEHGDRRSQRRANAGRSDKKAEAPAYGAPLSTPKPQRKKRPRPGPADAATRRREIARRVQEGQEATRRGIPATKTEAPKPEPTTIGKPGRSTYETLRDRDKDVAETIEEME